MGDGATQEEARHGIGSAGVQVLLLAGSFLTHKSDGSERSSCVCCLNSAAAPAKFTTPTSETNLKRLSSVYTTKNFKENLICCCKKDDCNPANLFLPRDETKHTSKHIYSLIRILSRIRKFSGKSY